MTHPTYDPADVPAWPAYELTVHADGKVEAAGPLVPSATHPHRHAAIGTVVEASARLGRPVRAKATEADGTVWHLVVAPDGSVGELPVGRSAAPSRKRAGKSSSRAARTAPQAPPAATAPPAEAEPAFADGLALVAEHLEAGRIEVAAELAARLDRRAADTLGVSHPDALRIREVLARISALLGDTAGGVRLFRDVAERWHYRGAHADAESAASRAVALWLQITDVDTALATGMSMVRMRNQIPGENGTALTEVLTHQSLLESQKAGATAATREPAVDAAPRVAGAGDGTAQEWAGAGPVGPVGPDQASTGWAQAPGPESSPTDTSSADTSGPAEADRPETTSAVAATPDAGWAGADPADAAWVEAARAVGDTPPAWLATAGAAAGPGPVESAPVGEPPLPAGSETPAWPAASPVDVTPTATEPAPTEPGGPRPVQPVQPLPSVDDGTPAWLEAAQVAAVVPPAWLDAAPEPRTPAEPTPVAQNAVQQAPAPQPEAPQPEVPQSEMPQPGVPQPSAPRAPSSQAPAVRPAFSWDRPARDSRTGG
ncbi:hypothetical protein RM863_01615 [Streptomyces sp. DSM 41014]|uniref:Tetratricopeptide repeat protein n=1 Tax=Streptomyces hintoniae TaxID=3075521 RepID=A0ABU2UC71_9ACTN|nr:hypothetical protein [Streptomyces sp. DSM 41014]MDT0470838.1 hypothetical protein [Streptomyces sp. DSM 41014]